MNRKLSLILASLALVTVLAGCGNTKDNNTADTDKVPTTNDTMPTPGTDEKGDKDDAANDLQTNDAAGNTDGGNTSTTAGNASKACLLYTSSGSCCARSNKIRRAYLPFVVMVMDFPPLQISGSSLQSVKFHRLQSRSHCVASRLPLTAPPAAG